MSPREAPGAAKALAASQRPRVVAGPGLGSDWMALLEHLLATEFADVALGVEPDEAKSPVFPKPRDSEEDLFRERRGDVSVVELEAVPVFQVRELLVVRDVDVDVQLGREMVFVVYDEARADQEFDEAGVRAAAWEGKG